MKDRHIITIFILLSMGVFITGLYWGLPSPKLSQLYFSKTEHLQTTITEIKKTEVPRSSYNPIRSYHPDEYFIIKCLQTIEPQHIFNSGQFSIGGAFLFLYGFLLFVLYKLHFLHLTRYIPFYFLNPPEIARFYIVGRLLCALYATGTVILTYLLAKKMWKNKFYAFLSGILLIFSPLFLLNSHYMYVDIPAVFWMMLALFLSVKYLQGDKVKPFIIGLVAGISAGNKITFLLTFFIPLITFTIVKEDLKMKLKNVCLSFISFIIILFLTTPYLFTALYHLFYSEGSHATQVSFTPGFYLLSLKYGLGLPLLLFLSAGVFTSFFKKGNIHLSTGKVLILLWIVILLSTMSLLSLKFARYILPAIPPFIVIGTGGWLTAGENKGQGFIKNTIIGFVVISTFIYGMAFKMLFVKENIRTEAGVWIKENIPQGSSMGVTEVPWQFQMSPFDYYVYPVVVTGYNIEELKKKQPDFFILSSFQAPIPPYPLRLQEERKRFYEEFMKSGLYSEIKRFERYPSFLCITFKNKTLPEDLIYLNPTIVIFRKKEAEK